MERAPLFLESVAGKFNGAEAYRVRMSDLSIGQVIRCNNYGVNSGEEARYVVGEKGVLYDQNGEEVKPEEVFSDERNPNGWVFEGSDLCMLSDEVLRDLFERDFITLNF